MPGAADELRQDEGGRRDPYRQASGFLMGTAAGSMFFNLLSTSIGFRGVAVIALAAGLIAMIGWLRRLPRRAPLSRAAIPVLLSLALIAAIAALAPGWSGPATILAALLLLTGAGLAATLERAVGLVVSIAAISCGIFGIAFGLAGLRATPIGAAYVAIGVGLVVMVVAGPRRTRLAGVALIGAGFGAGIIGLTGALLHHSDFLFGAMFVVMGIAIIGLGTASFRGRVTLMRAGLLVSGVPIAVLGVVFIHTSTAVGASFIAMGIGIISLGAALVIDDTTLASTAAMGLGIAMIALGVALIPDVSALVGAASVGIGISIVGYAAQTLHHLGATARVWRRLTAMTREPPSPPNQPVSDQEPMRLDP